MSEDHGESSPVSADADRYNNVTVPGELEPIYTSLEIACAVLSIVGNAFVIYLFVKKTSLRSVKNCYILSLASADLLVGLVGVPSAVSVSVGLPTNFPACLFMTSVLMLLCTGSIMSLVAVTIDRFWSIVRPLTYPVTMTHNAARTVILVSWSVSAVVGLLPLFGWNRGAPPEPRCFFVEVMDPRYLVFVFFGTIVAPSVVMAIIYAVIYREVRRQGHILSALFVSANAEETANAATRTTTAITTRRALSRPSHDRLTRRQLTVEAKTVKSVAIVVVVFLVSWLPLYIVNTVMYFRPEWIPPNGLMTVTILLSHYNSVWNPLLYAWKMKDFRLALKRRFTTSSSRSLQTMRSR